LINCHLFVKIVQAEYIPVLETENVIKFVQIARNLISIPQREMDIMQRVVGEEYAVTMEPNGLIVGDDVEIIAGSLTGIRGKLVSTPERKVVVIELESTGFQLRMDVPMEAVQKINSN
ncbi:MAG: transcription termination/antitermination protein NusG, partial [Saprospiraceae bacterium]